MKCIIIHIENLSEKDTYPWEKLEDEIATFLEKKKLVAKIYNEVTGNEITVNGAYSDEAI